MSTGSVHAIPGVREVYAQRGLQTTFPALREFLYTGARVLDIGCGPGSITIDVAEFVSPGEVVGIDPVAESIEQANTAKDERSVPNVSFEVGNACELRFQDYEFDVVYAHAVVSWIADPAKTLSEMRRVTKSGGTVLFDFCDDGSMVMYPRCPAFERVRAERHEHWNDTADPDRYYDVKLGRRIAELLAGAGFDDFRMNCTPKTILFGHDEPLNIDYELAWLDYEIFFGAFYGKLFALNVLDKETVDEARREIQEWAVHPFASLIPVTHGIAVGRA